VLKNIRNWKATYPARDGKRFTERIINLSLGLSEGDIIRYLCAALGGNETPHAMDESRGKHSRKIPENVSGM